MKRILAIFLLLFIVISVCSCSNHSVMDLKKMKIGVVLYADADDSLISSHVDAIKKMQTEIGFREAQIKICSNVSASDCFDTIITLVEDGCNLVFSVGREFEDYMVQAATEYADVHFCVANGIQPQTNGLPNLHSYSVKEFEARYIAGVAARLKLQDMVQNSEILKDNVTIGYIGTAPNAENISSYTAFYLGAKSSCPDVRMKVKYRDDENDQADDERIANALIANGCKLITQQDYSNDAARNCESNSVFFIGHLGSATDDAPYYAVTSSTTDWTEAYLYPLRCIENGESIPTEWSSDIKNADSFILPLNQESFPISAHFEKASSELSGRIQQLIDQNIKVFDINSFTINGERVDSTSGEEFYDIYHGTEYINPIGYFMENELTSVPMFELLIDGIEILP